MTATKKGGTGRSGRRLTSKGRQTRDRIVATAAALMDERGVARTTIEDIRLAAGVSASQMYHYFADKNSLVGAVIDMQADRVLSFQHLGLDRVRSFADLCRWRDLVVAVVTQRNCAGGCPLGSLAHDLAETDPVSRAKLDRAFAHWEQLLRDGLSAMARAGQFSGDVDTDTLALALLGATQGGLLLSQVRRDVAPLQAAMDVVIAHIGCHLAPGARDAGE